MSEVIVRLMFVWRGSQPTQLPHLALAETYIDGLAAFSIPHAFLLVALPSPCAEKLNLGCGRSPLDNAPMSLDVHGYFHGSLLPGEISQTPWPLPHVPEQQQQRSGGNETRIKRSRKMWAGWHVHTVLRSSEGRVQDLAYFTAGKSFLFSLPCFPLRSLPIWCRKSGTRPEPLQQS